MKHSSNYYYQSPRNKHQKQLLPSYLLFIIVIFALGYFLGFYIGSNKQQKIQFIMPPQTSDTQVSVVTQENETEPEVSLPKELPWNLTLVNFENPLPKDFAPDELTVVDNTHVADSRIEEITKQMIADARAENVRIIALSAYRDYDYQTELYENKVSRLQQEKGYSITKAREEAATVVAYPGTSEHQLGLALDLVDASHMSLNQSQENTAAYKWLVGHCHEYGFIVRYPNGKTDITGIIYEPWHFRYVGTEAAAVIMENNLTLEEYLADYYEN